MYASTESHPPRLRWLDEDGQQQHQDDDDARHDQEITHYKYPPEKHEGCTMKGPDGWFQGDGAIAPLGEPPQAPYHGCRMYPSASSASPCVRAGAGVCLEAGPHYCGVHIGTCRIPQDGVWRWTGRCRLCDGSGMRICRPADGNPTHRSKKPGFVGKTRFLSHKNLVSWFLTRSWKARAVRTGRRMELGGGRPFSVTVRPG